MNFEDHISQALETLTERLRGEIDQEVERRTAAALAAMPAPEPIRHAPPQPEGDRDATQRLDEGFAALDRARSLTDVLDTLLAHAREDSPGADLWLLRDGRLHQWRANEGDHAADTTPPRVEDGLALAIAGQTVAVLIANAAGRTQNAEFSAHDSELRSGTEERRTQNDEPRPTTVSLLCRYASQRLEALTALQTARALTQRATADTAPPAGDGSDDDSSARRYARLLVSEIKLYHEPAVIAGRRDRDLAARLGGEIAHARAMYEQRVPPRVRERADYFHDELVKTLADGDSGLLEVRA